jgi:hypothetical protein
MSAESIATIPSPRRPWLLWCARCRTLRQFTRLPETLAVLTVCATCGLGYARAISVRDRFSRSRVRPV